MSTRARFGTGLALAFAIAFALGAAQGCEPISSCKKPGQSTYAGSTTLTGSASPNGSADTLAIDDYWPDAYCPSGSAYEIQLASCTFDVQETNQSVRGDQFISADGAITGGSCTFGGKSWTAINGTITFDRAKATVDVTLSSGAEITGLHFSGSRS